jgi:hypothetical protein
MSADQNSKATVQIALRISPELRERVKSAAENNNRSVNSELTATLEEKYPPAISAERLESLLNASSGLLDAIEGVVNSDEAASKNVSTLRIHLADVQAKAELDGSPSERQRLFHETQFIFDRISDGLARALDAAPAKPEQRKSLPPEK